MLWSFFLEKGGKGAGSGHGLYHLVHFQAFGVMMQVGNGEAMIPFLLLYHLGSGKGVPQDLVGCTVPLYGIWSRASSLLGGVNANPNPVLHPFWLS